MKKTLKLYTILVLATIMLLTCLTPLMASGDIKIGVILAETGPASFLGGPEIRSLQMLVEEMNEKGGINGNKITLITRDSGASSEKAISFTRQLIEEEKVFAIIGPSTSGESLKVKKMCEDSHTILISCASADLIVQPVSPYIFKTAPSDGLAVHKIFKTMNTLGLKKIAVLSGNTGFGKAGKQHITTIAPEYGIEIVASEVYDQDATDLSAIVAKLKSNPGIDAIINWSVVPAQSIAAKNIRQAGWNVPLFQSHGFANIKYVEAAGAAAEGIIFPASKLIIADKLESSSYKDFLLKFKNNYEKKYNEQVSAFGGHSYDAMLLLAQAIEKVGVDKDQVRAALETTTGFFGTAGEFNFSAKDHSGLSVDAFTMLTVKKGKFVPYE